MMMNTHTPSADVANAYIGFRLAHDLNERLIRAAGDNRSAFIRDAIKRHILAREEDETVLTGAS